jgi:hypothetical protein
LSITTYAELVTALENWTHRSDVSARIPEFIALAENRVNFGSMDPQFKSDPLRVRAMQNRDSGNASSGAISFPTGYLETILLKIQVGGKNSVLTYRAPPANAPYESEAGNASFYTVLNNAIQVGPSSAAYVHDYYKKFDALTASATTNWLITNSPNVYLYGALIEAAPYMGKDAKLATWYRMFAGAINALQSSDRRAAYAGGTLAVVAVS